MSTYSKGSDALILKDGSFASGAILVLEGVALEGSLQNQRQMEVAELPDALRSKSFKLFRSQRLFHLRIISPPLAVDTSPFEDLIDMLLEPMEAQSFLVYMLMTSFFDSTDFRDMIRLINEAFQCLSMFNLDFKGVHDQFLNFLCLHRECLAVRVHSKGCFMAGILLPSCKQLQRSSLIWGAFPANSKMTSTKLREGGRPKFQD